MGFWFDEIVRKTRLVSHVNAPASRPHFPIDVKLSTRVVLLAESAWGIDSNTHTHTHTHTIGLHDMWGFILCMRLDPSDVGEQVVD